jgi:hypothetical protein
MLSLQILHSAHFLLWLPTIAAISVQTANKNRLCNEIYLNTANAGGGVSKQVSASGATAEI